MILQPLLRLLGTSQRAGSVSFLHSSLLSLSLAMGETKAFRHGTTCPGLHAKSRNGMATAVQRPRYGQNDQGEVGQRDGTKDCNQLTYMLHFPYEWGSLDNEYVWLRVLGVA